jgi:mannose-1-phosphate guanylyltransferase
MNKHHYLAIMAGGVGSRFWPESRTNNPKQFIDILGIGKSMLRMTYERFLPLIDNDNIYVVTNEMYRDLVKQHIPELKDHQILCEPSRNNTAPSVAYTTWKLHNLDPKSSFIMASSDHLILDEHKMRDIMQKALDFTDKNNALVTLGIQPLNPNTGYGYVQYEKKEVSGMHKVLRFTEKPDATTAQSFLDSGDYLWNSGMFVWKTKDLITAFEQYAPKIFQIFEKGNGFYNTPNELTFINEYYPQTPSISIDYAIMENATNIFTIPSSFGWSDVGSWASLYEVGVKNNCQNMVKGDRVITYDTTNSLIRASNDKLLIVRGLDNFIVVDNDDVLLIFPKENEQDIKKVTEELKVKLGDDYL